MRQPVSFTLIITLIVSLYAMTAAATAEQSSTLLSRQLTLYHTLQQRIAQPGEISDEALAGLKLLLAQLYSEMGMLLAAESTLDALQGGPSIRQLRDMGRLLLARQYRLRGEMAAAAVQLSAIAGGLNEELENERQQMLALSAFERGDIDQALLRYAKVQGASGAVLLARFNYAALLLRGGQASYGLDILQVLAERDDGGPGVAALRDRANLLLGYYFLQQQEHQDAQRFLRRVRLSGPYSRAALLALGWAELAQRGAEYAMVPWMELLAYDRGDSLDEEVELAIATAIASKGASQRVIDHYQRLSVKFKKEREALKLERQRHAQAYAPQKVAAVLEGETDPLARNSVAGVTLIRLLALRQRLDAEGAVMARLDESNYFQQLWSQLHTLYPEPDEFTGIGVVAYVARRTESFIYTSLQTSSRSPHSPSNLAEYIRADHATLDGEIAVVAEWYRRTRLAALHDRDERLRAYMERVRLAIARTHDQALRRQEQE
ncbi:MAG: hypothetical protein ABFS08_02105 [Pseudomonadota bacterium]